MFALIVSSARHNRSRYVATLVAIMTGVAFFVATGLISDRVTTSLEGDAARQYANVDVAVVPTKDESSEGFAGAADQLRISGAVADKIAAVDGAEATGGTLVGGIALERGDKPFATDAAGRLWITDEELNPLEIAEGRAPAAAGEIAVDQGTADAHDVKVGEQLKVLSLDGTSNATVVGITKFGSSDAVDQNGTVSLPEATAFAMLNSGKRAFDSLYVRGSKPQSELKAEIDPLVPDGFEGQSGDAFVDEQKANVGDLGRFLKRGLQAFAILALLVGGFVIYNTFTVIFAQRLRELAVLSAIGATPGQLKRMLTLEGALIGLVGSVLGVLAGIALALLLFLVVAIAGVDLPGSGLGLSLSTVLVGIVLGTAITLFSVRIPARRAAKIQPIEALRAAAVEPASLGRRRAITGGLLAAFGVLGMTTGGTAATVGLSAVFLFAGTIVASPYLALGAAKIARPVLSRFGLEGRLAVDNVARSPRRTATTANALLIGVFLVTFVTVTGTNLRDYVVDVIDESSSADYLVRSTGGTIDDGLIAQFKAVDGVDQVAAFSLVPATIDGKAAGVSAADDLDQVTKIASVPMKAGSLDEIGPGEIALNARADASYKVGQEVKVATNDGPPQTLKVAALIDPESIDAQLLGNLVAPSTLDELAGTQPPTVAFLDIQTGKETDAKDQIEAVADRRPDIEVTEGNFIGKLIGGIFDFVIKAVDLLLMMSVLIALVGIVNTLSLAIIERRRELGLLRVVGMTDKLVQRMVRLESVLIAALGTIVGVALGLFAGWALITSINRLSDAELSFAFPLGTIAVVLLAGTALGVLAALIPARRSTRMAVLDALDG